MNSKISVKRKRQMGSLITSKRLTILAFVTVVTILSLPLVVLSAEKTQETEVQEVLKPQLVPLFSITGEYAGRRLGSPGDVFIDEENGEIYVVDSGNARVLIFDMEGYYKYQFAAPAGMGGITS